MSDAHSNLPNLAVPELVTEIERLQIRSARWKDLLVKSQSHLSWMIHRLDLTNEFRKDVNNTLDEIGKELDGRS
jgi:hypothetical protein